MSNEFHLQAAPPNPPYVPDYAALLDQMRAFAREDFNAFCECVIKDERRGTFLKQAPLHQAWAEQVEAHERLIIWSHVEAGKTTQISTARPLWFLGRDPMARIAIVSRTYGLAGKIAGAIRRYIETDPDYHAVFPHVQASEPWSENQFTIKRPFPAKDPSVQACGIGGHIMGSRIDFLILDDVLDWDNSRTKAARDKTWDWFNSELIGRLTASARVLTVGNAYHPDDLLHRLARELGWTAQRYPVMDDKGNPRWPERWPKSRIEGSRSGPNAMIPSEFARQLMCVTRADEDSRFKDAYIQSCMRRGDGKHANTGKPDECLNFIPPGYRIFTGVDLAVQKKDSADLTCLFTIAVTPYEDREVLECVSGRWDGPQIINRIADVQRRWQSIVLVENNAAQDYIRQFLGVNHALPVYGFNTGSNKANPEFGVESLAGEMAQGKWIIPNNNGRSSVEIEAWISEMRYYQPDSHTGDRLMASWFAREGVRMSDKNKGTTWNLNLRAR